ncbi:MAG: DUF4440 domain-containing protein [Saprospiraceae bacterium]|nr:DUF4440 domain-containing protein [Saprospiraceae bacterium]
MKYTWLLIHFVCMTSLLQAQSPDEQYIRTKLGQQVAAWNRSDVEAYMQFYWHSDSLMYIGKSGITYGWQQTQDNYTKRYPDPAAMGHLTDKIIVIKLLSPDYMQVIGQWHLTRSIGDIEGYYTLLIRKISGHWLIVQDHTS